MFPLFLITLLLLACGSEPQLPEARTPAPAAAAIRSAQPKAYANLSLPFARNLQAPFDAPELVVSQKKLVLDGVEISEYSASAENAPARWLEPLAVALEARRERWLQQRPDTVFHGVLKCAIAAEIRATDVKSVFFTAALSGFPNLVLVLKDANVPQQLGNLLLDGRTPGLADWPADVNQDVVLNLELTDTEAIGVWWQTPTEPSGPRGSISLSEAAQALQALWGQISPHPAPSDPRPHRAAIAVAAGLPFASLVQLIDAVSEPKRDYTIRGVTQPLRAFVPVIVAERAEQDALIRGWRQHWLRLPE